MTCHCTVKIFQNSIKWIRRWQGHFFQIVTFDFYIIDKVGPLQQLFHVYGANVDHLSHHTVVVSRVVVITPPATTNGQRRPKVGGIGRVCWWGLFSGSEWKEMRGHIPPRSNGHYQLISMKFWFWSNHRPLSCVVTLSGITFQMTCV